jgi:hypothetical protein
MIYTLCGKQLESKGQGFEEIEKENEAKVSDRTLDRTLAQHSVKRNREGRASVKRLDAGGIARQDAG